MLYNLVIFTHLIPMYQLWKLYNLVTSTHPIPIYQLWKLYNNICYITWITITQYLLYNLPH